MTPGPNRSTPGMRSQIELEEVRAGMDVCVTNDTEWAYYDGSGYVAYGPIEGCGETVERLSHFVEWGKGLPKTEKGIAEVLARIVEI